MTTINIEPNDTPEVIALKAELAKMKEDMALLKSRAPAVRAPSFKVSEKGAVSVYGLGRFPMTLYRAQWERLFAVIPQLKAFIEENKARLTEKGDESPAEKAEREAHNEEQVRIARQPQTKVG